MLGGVSMLIEEPAGFRIILKRTSLLTKGLSSAIIVTVASPSPSALIQPLCISSTHATLKLDVSNLSFLFSASSGIAFASNLYISLRNISIGSAGSGGLNSIEVTRTIAFVTVSVTCFDKAGLSTAVMVIFTVPSLCVVINPSSFTDAIISSSEL